MSETAVRWADAAVRYLRAKALQRKEFQDLVLELERFIVSDESEAARMLLAATGKHIDLASVGSMTYVLDAGGFCRQDEDRQYYEITAEDIAQVIVQYGGKKPCEVMKFLRDQLDHIAAAAHNP